MATWQIIRPLAAENLVDNPSLETNTTGWALLGGVGTIARVAAYASAGVYSLNYAIQLGQPYPQGAYTTVGLAATTDYYFSAFCYHTGTNDRSMLLRVRTGGGSTIASVNFTLPGGTFIRTVLPFTTTGAGNYTCEVLQAAQITGIQNFYLDAVMVSEENVTYLDGDSPGALWLGTAHASPSFRPASTRAGGELVPLSDYGFYITRELNTDELSPDYLEQDKPFEPGTRATGLKVPRRVWGLTGQIRADAAPDFEELKNEFINDTSPLLVPRDTKGVPQPVRWRRVGTARTLEIAGNYAGGLEGNYDSVFECKEDVALQVVSQAPYWYEIPETGALLDANDVQSYQLIAARESGVWGNIPVSAIAGAGIVYAQAIGPDGTLYVGGDFSSLDGIANANYIASYDLYSDTWSALSTGLNGVVYALEFAPDGTLYVGGAFTNAGGDANADYIATWDGTAFAALTANPLDNNVYAIAFYPPTGGIILGGDFTQDSTPTTLDYIASFTPGGAFAAVGVGLDAATFALGVQSDGQIIAGGDATNRLNAYNATDGWYGVYNTVALNGRVNALVVTGDDTVFVGGAFTTLDGETVNRLIEVFTVSIGYTGWSACGTGLTGGDVFGLAYDTQSSELYVAGQFTTVSGLDNGDYLVRWTGNAFAPVMTNVPGAPPAARSVVLNLQGDVFFGFGAAGTSESAGYTTITLTTGASETYPLVTVKRSGGTYARLFGLWNITTDERIDFTGFDILDGETIKIDMLNKTVTSDFGRNLGNNPVPGSSLRTWYLQAGANVVALFVSISGAPTVEAKIMYNTAFWSVRATEQT